MMPREGVTCLTGPMGRDLAQHDCKGTCNWGPTDERIDDLQVFECASCHSEWTPAQAWTPRNAEGELSPEVAAARAENPVQSSW